MILTLVALTSMGTAQPALLYLIPLTLIPVYIVAYFRKDLQTMWNAPERQETTTVSLWSCSTFRQKQIQEEAVALNTALPVNNVSAENV